MIDNTKYIENYISGALNEQEMEQFELRVDSDHDFHDEYQLIIKTREFLKARNTLHEVENDPDLPNAEALVREHFEQEATTEYRESRTRKIVFLSLPTAATLVGIILLISTLLKSDPLSRLYEHYYFPLETEEIHNLIVRDARNSNIASGLEYYRNGSYLKAIDQFKRIENCDYYIGLSFLGLENYRQAQIHFLVFYQTNTHHPEVNWYLGLTNLKLNNIDQSIEHLERLFLMANPYQRAASRILRKLKKINAADEQ